MIFSKDWHISGKNNSVSVEISDEFYRVVVDVQDDKPCYLVHRRDKANFTEAPVRSSIDIGGAGWLSLTYECEVEQSTVSSRRIEGGVATYVKRAGSTHEKHLYFAENNSLWNEIPDHTDSCTLFFRISGKGIYTISEIDLVWFDQLFYDDVNTLGFSSRVLDSIDDSNSVHINVNSYSPTGSESSAIITAAWSDSQGHQVPGVPEYAINSQLGPYQYLEPSKSVYNFSVPQYASSVEIQIRSWKKKGDFLLSREWTVEGFTEPLNDDLIDETNLNSILGLIPSDDRLVVLHTTAPPLGHATLSLRPNRLAAEFTKLGIYVIFLPFSKVPGGIERHSDKAWIVCRSLWPKLQYLLSKRNNSKDVFVCTSFPNFEAVSALDLLNSSGWTTVYEIRDDMEEFNRVGYSKWFDNQLEQYVLERADHVTTVSPRLAEKAAIIAGRNDVRVVPNAVSDFLLENGKPHRTIESQRRKYGSKVVGYLGHLTDSWFDWSTLLDVATQLEEYEFRVIGHGMPNHMVDRLPSNVNYLGPMDHASFVEESKNWAVGLIPFKLSPLTFGVDPNKLYEYLALGVKVVSAPMGGVGSAPWSKVYRGAEEMKQSIVATSSERVTEEDIAELDAYLNSSSWGERAQQMINIFESEVS
ncbi:glycosyltransferase family protein [Glutamicibacter arilaitensis]|uniref:Glycosyltransferase n=1 Tax=Glutamicibacter arilaitensis TaxID=256701 RepID=A0A4Y8U130_9MICC|nr:hypothetical protein [Glutamicibacter arilaitensis]TFH57459.1 hypothetical protein EXY26_10925 [Glutamicibacter arilaitensis]